MARKREEPRKQKDDRLRERQQVKDVQETEMSWLEGRGTYASDKVPTLKNKLPSADSPPRHVAFQDKHTCGHSFLL